jgi:hypothetical protein
VEKKMNSNIKEITYSDEFLASKLLQPIDYSDCFELKSEFTTIDNFAKNYFVAQPSWLRAVSFGIFRKKTLDKILAHISFQKDEVIGQWRVYGRDEKEIVFGQHMGFMEYCFTFHQEDNQTIKVATVVQYKGKMGRYYFAIASLLHKLFVQLSLENSLK